ncbi:MAG: hypothetical protein LBG10_06845 [Treponema sp.]|jgi:hypothetical protein|nr:hypothetical protein [Treponema sp.]
MFFKSSLGILIFLSLLTGFLLAVFAAALMPPETGGAYAALVMDESWPDREIRGLLNDETIISEASQWAFLDDFEGLSRIPLDEYRNRVQSFDPRNDGYAEKLRAFFVRDGKRLFFIPLHRGFWGYKTGEFEKRLSSSLGDIPFEIIYLGYRRPVWLYMALLAGAGMAGLFLSGRFALGFCMPLLAGFAFAGSSGLALSSVFAGLAGLFLAPCGEYFMFRRYRRADTGAGKFEGRRLGDMLVSFRPCWVLTPVFLAALVFISVAGNVHPLVVLAGGAGFTGIFLFSQWVLSRRGDGQGHVRFVPVLIRPVPVKSLEFPRIMLPFICASLLPALPLPPFSGVSSAGDSVFFGEQGGMIREGEYHAHAAFQASFSYRALGSGGAGEPAYFQYRLGDDGLIAGREADIAPRENIPPFPLKDLMNFLETGGKPSPQDWSPLTFAQLAPVLAALLFSFPAFIRRVRGDKKGEIRLLYRYKEKGIAA